MWEPRGIKAMWIERFTVCNFRKLTAGVSVNGLQPGITVIVGENEEGKSTMLRALQSGFFDRHKLGGKPLEQMMPFGAQGVNPSIDVTFQVAGTSYRLSKSFGTNAAAQLEGGNRLWQGEAAEDRLRELLGFSRPGRGAAGEEHRGLAGLLWVEQGRAFRPLAINQDSQVVLREAIEGEVGQVLGGDRGRRLLEQVEKRTGNFFTPTGREREPLSGPRKRVQALIEDCKELDNELQVYDNQVKQLSRLQESLARYQNDGVLTTAKQEAEKSNVAIRRLDVVEERLNVANARMEKATSDKDMAEGAGKSRRELINDVAVADQQAGAAENTLKTLDPDYQDASGRLAEAEERLTTCNKQREEANREWEAARQAREQSEIVATLQELGQKFRQAQSLNEQIERKGEEITRNLVNEDDLCKLRELRSRQIRLDSALKAVAATLVFSPEGAQGVSFNGRPVNTGQPVHVTRSRRFHLHGFGALDVTPGGQDLVQLRTDLDTVTHQLGNMLRRLKMADLAGAEAALRAKQSLAAHVESLRGELRGVAPQGLATLQTTLKERQARLLVLAAESDGGDSRTVETARSVEQAALEHWKKAKRAADRAMQEREQIRRSHDRIREKRINADAERKQRAEIAKERRAALETARHQITDGQLMEQVEQKAQLFAECRSNYEMVLAERDAMNPEAMRMEQQRASEVYSRLQEKINADERAEHDLAIELRTLGQRGLAEELAQKKGELTLARVALERVEADAKAWKLLRDTLRHAENEAKETFLGPVRERLRPYLRMLFPETELQLSEDNLEILSLRRGGVEEPFAALSIGAREQVAVLTRLALADLLRENGRPVVLILDDPLVNSDDERFRRMELALRKAANTSLQIIILTCHEARYETLGAKIIRLADCRTLDVPQTGRRERRE